MKTDKENPISHWDSFLQSTFFFLFPSHYQKKKEDTDAVIVDRWFQTVCKHVLAENYEQWEVNQPQDSRARQNTQNDLGDGRTEVS